MQSGASRSVFIKWEKGSIGFSLAWDNSELLCPTTCGERVDGKKEGSIKNRERDQRSRRDNQTRDNRGIRDTANKPQNRISSRDLEGFRDFSLCIWVWPSFDSLIRFYLPAPLCSFPEVTISNFSFKRITPLEAFTPPPFYSQRGCQKKALWSKKVNFPTKHKPLLLFLWVNSCSNENISFTFSLHVTDRTPG